MHTVSKEIAMKLKEAGLPQIESGWYWVRVFEDNSIDLCTFHYAKKKKRILIAYAADLDELIRQPELRNCEFFWDEIGGELLFWVEPPDANCIEDLFSEVEPADACALAWIAMKKNNP